MNPITIRRATAREIRDLRHRVLRQGLPIEAADFPGDDHPDTIHIAAVDADGSVVGCATLMPEPYHGEPAWRLRGMAVDTTLQRSGVGRRLLAAVDDHARTVGPPLLWCNARLIAIPFYTSLGWVKHDELFDIPAAGPHYVMTKHL